MDFWGGWGGGEMVGTDLSDLPNKFKFKGWGDRGEGTAQPEKFKQGKI